MSKNMESLTAIDRAVEKLVTALERIATEHGSEAVDLVLVAYRIDAIQYLVLCVLGMLLIIPAIPLWRMFYREVIKDDEREYVSIPCLIGAAITSGSGVVGFLSALSPVTWLAAFGYPEIMIATNVLKSAGLL